MSESEKLTLRSYLPYMESAGPSCTNQSPLQETLESTQLLVSLSKEDRKYCSAPGEFLSSVGLQLNSDLQASKLTPHSLGVFTTLPFKTWACLFL